MRYRPKRENYDNGVYGEIDYQKNLEKYCTYLENQNKQLALTDVSFELPDDEKLNNYEVDIETPLKEFYFYHRPHYLRHEQKEFRESLEKALKYLQGN